MFNRFARPASLIFVLSFVLFTGCDSAPEAGSGTVGEPEVTSVAPDEATTQPVLTGVSYQSGETLTIKVPEMNCPFYCYPKVEETLTELGGIEKIELVSQKEEDKIDDPRIIIKLSKELDWETATKALEEAGFGGATVVAIK